MSARVLIVDDDVQIRRVYARALARHFAVECASDVEAAIALLEAGAVFDGFLCDLNLPSLTGSDLHGYLQRRSSALAARLVIITGEEPRANDPFTAMLLASERYLIKTCSLIELTTTMCRVAA